jgi:integrase
VVLLLAASRLVEIVRREVERMIRQRGGWWQVRVYVGIDPVTGRRQYRYAHTDGAQEARAVEARLKAEAPGLGTDPERGRTLGRLLSRWLAWVEELDVVAPSTLVGYRHWAERVATPARGRVPVAQVDVALLEGWLAVQRRAGGRRGRPLSPSSLHDLHAILVAALDRAVAWGWCATNPARLVRLPPVELPEVVPPSVGEVARLLAAAWAADPLFGLFVRLAAVVGARRGELCALRWSDVDFPRGELLVARSVVAVPGRGVLVGPTKTRRRRRVALDRVTVDLLATLRARAQAVAERAGVRWCGSEYVFAPRPDVLTRRFARLRTGSGWAAGCMTCGISCAPSSWLPGSTWSR